MTRPGIRAVLFASAALAALSACVAPGAAPRDGAAPVARAATSTRLVDRDVEAPQVFQVSDQALWDGRPSLGGVWVASPDAVDPERVIMRNPANGRSVIGALFRRERLNPGPALQISSDAAAALGILAGQPAEIGVVALRREEVADVAEVADAAAAPVPGSADAPAAAAAPAGAVETTALAAIDRAERTASAPAAEPQPDLAAADPGAGPALAPADPAAAPDVPRKRLAFWKRGARKAAALAPVAAVEAAPLDAAAAADATALARPAALRAAGGSIQIGIFAVEANAGRAVDALSRVGVAARVLTEASQGKTFWRVVADPGADRAAALAKARGAGFTDAYLLNG